MDKILFFLIRKLQLSQYAYNAVVSSYREVTSRKRVSTIINNLCYRDFGTRDANRPGLTEYTSSDFRCCGAADLAGHCSAGKEVMAKTTGR